MSGGGGDAPPPSVASGGEFLLSLLQKHPHQPQTPPQQPPSLLGSIATPITPLQQQQQQQQQQQHHQSLKLDPAVAAVGPTLPFLPPWQSNGRDLPPPPSWSHSLSPPFPPNLLGFPQNHRPPGNQFQVNQGVLGDDMRILGFSGIDVRGNTNYNVHNHVQQKQQEQKLVFGSFPSDFQSLEGLSNGNSFDNSKFNVAKERELGLGSRSYGGLDRNRQFDPRAKSNSNLNQTSIRHGNFDSREQERRPGGWGKQHYTANYRSTPSPETIRPPPGFSSMPRGGGGNWRRVLEHNVSKEKGNYSELNDNRNVSLNNGNDKFGSFTEDGRFHGDVSHGMGLSGQLDHPGPPTGSNLHSVSALDIEESLSNLHSGIHGGGEKSSGQNKMKKKEGGSVYGRDQDDLSEQLVDSLLLEDESEGKSDKKQHRNSREKESRSDGRGQRQLSQRMRNLKRLMECRSDIDRLNAPFIAIYESLIPAEEEKAKQKQLLTLLEKLVSKEWPEARLYLYGSCANSFGVSKSDIDVCLVIEDADINKSEILLKLADILQSDNLQNVQALTRARVPIVKLMDPVTGISCDICINNVLAVVNTKLLRDYAQIDVRLRQLAFIVKHWAKSRGVNETYQGTLSSYAYVLMCIHFLQQRRPSILPCLQEMETTYSVTVDDISCAFFDQVELLSGFGSRNKESISQLVWAFFNYWAYRHDYANDVISVRAGSIISKREKDWTRRIGNDRHLICIEDPFETSHDLGRVVDKYSIKVLREEFERAADIMQYDPNPCVTLFDPYVRS